MSSNRWGAVSQHIPAENQMEKSIMKFVSASRQIGLILGTLAVLSVPASAWSQEPQYKANVPKSLITPDKVQTELLGELEFTDGMPSDATVRKTLDFLDLSRAAEAFLNGIPPTSIYAMLEGLKQAGAEPGDLVFFRLNGSEIDHVGIYVGRSRFVHAPRRYQPVKTESLNNSYWGRKFTGGRRLG